MNYEEAALRYKQTREAIEAVERETKEKLAPLREKLAVLENWFSAKAQEEKLEKIPTKIGLIYWSTHASASVGSRGDFLDWLTKTQHWDAAEIRASSSAVKTYIEANGAPPPGVNFSQRRVFNFRAAVNKDI